MKKRTVFETVRLDHAVVKPLTEVVSAAHVTTVGLTTYSRRVVRIIRARCIN